MTTQYGGNIEKQGYGANIETGEIGVWIPAGKGYRVISPEEQRIINIKKEQARLQENDGRHFIASYQDEMRGIVQDLSLTESGYVMKLLVYIKLGESGTLYKDGKPMAKKDIAKAVKVSERAVKPIIDGLVEKGVMQVTKEGRSNIYAISDQYHKVGSGIRKSFVKVMKVEAREILSTLSVSEAGMLYKILGFFHMTQYVLCVEPNAPEKEIEPLSREKLAEAIGHDVATVTKTMAALKRKKVIATFSSGKQTLYVIRPTLAYRSIESEHFNTVMGLFKLAN